MQQFNDAFENHMSEILFTCNNNEFSLDTISGDIKEKQHLKLQSSIKKNQNPTLYLWLSSSGREGFSKLMQYIYIFYPIQLMWCKNKQKKKIKLTAS